jgi:hypothetical protein
MLKKQFIKNILVCVAITLLLFVVNSSSIAFAQENQNFQSSDFPYERPLLNIAEQLPGFGGVFFDDNGDLNVYMAETQEELAKIRLETGKVKNALANVFGDDFLLQGSNIHSNSQKAQSPSQIKIIKGDYDIVQLYKWRTRLNQVLSLPGVISTDLNEGKNRLVVGVESLKMRQQIKSILVRLLIPKEAVIIEKTEPVEFAASLKSKLRPVQGGVQVEADTAIFDFKTCTMGFNAIRNNRNGFVTNSHCTAEQGGSEDTDFHQPDDPIFNERNKIGDEIADPVFFTGGICPSGRRCRYSDSAFIEYDASSFRGSRIARTTGWNNGSTTINDSNPTFNIISETLTPIQGAFLDKVGITTGWTYGRVEETCKDIAKVNDITLLCQSTVNRINDNYQIADFGDSGSPVFLWLGNNVSLAGVLWGVNNNSSSFAFSPLGYIEQELGQLQTFGFRPPSPPPPSGCGVNQRCCEPAPDGGCLLCVPQDAECP